MMEKLVNLGLSKSAECSISQEVSVPLMVCTHERSGTHFLMNYLNSCTNYTARPHFGFDYYNICQAVNPYGPASVSRFFQGFRAMKSEEKTYCVNSIVKSHFPVEFVSHLDPSDLLIIYVYRSPVDVFVSYWKFLHALGWFEGPRVISPLQLARHVPCGYSQRYQVRNYGSYFERWARHVASATQAADQSRGIALVSYESLKDRPRETIQGVCGRIGIKLIAEPVTPSRDEHVVKGANLQATAEMVEELRYFCSSELPKFRGLPEDVLAAGGTGSHVATG